MEIRRLSFADHKRFAAFLPRSFAPLPFHKSRSVQKRGMLQAFYLGEVWGAYTGRHLCGAFHFSRSLLDGEWRGLLWEQGSRNAWDKLFLFAVRSLFLPAVVLPEAVAEYLKIAGTQPAAAKKRRLPLAYRTGLVLGGGGVHGAYQIGVCQALAELGISFSLAAGTSVGALNGLLLSRLDANQMEAVWLAFCIEAGKLAEMPLERTIASYLSKVPHAGGRFPLYFNAVRLPKFKEETFVLDELAPPEQRQALLGSAAFAPFMKAVKTPNGRLVDGGYRDNLPVGLAVAGGARELIVIDVQGSGHTKKSALAVMKKYPHLYLRSPWPLGAMLRLDVSVIKKNIRLGYLETMKALGFFYGKWYTFEKKDFFKECAALAQAFCTAHPQYAFESVWPRWPRFLEAAAKAARIAPGKVYTLQQLTDQLQQAYPKIYDQKSRDFFGGRR